MEETPLQATPALTPLPKKKINKRFIYLIVGIVILVLLFFGYKTLSSQNTTKDIQDIPAATIPTDAPTQTPVPSPSETPIPTPTNTPTPKPTLNPVDQSSGLDRSELSITVENGSGEVGVAAEASDTLKNLGYDVISTKNAENYDYTNVTIQVKASESDYLNLLKKDLGFSYTIESATSDLSNSFSSDALVIIGK